MSHVSTAAAAGLAEGIVVRLSSNESPHGPSPAAMRAALDVLAHGRVYPDDAAEALRSAIASAVGSDPDQVMVAAGSTQLLHDTVLHLSTGGSVLTYDKAFAAYKAITSNLGIPHDVVAVGGPATADAGGYQRSVEALIDRIHAGTDMVIIDHPGNPTGAHLTGAQLHMLLQHVPETVTVIVDEAYFHFADGHAGYESSLSIGHTHPRVLTTRTFSKAHALAGLRIGYLVGPREIVRELDARRARFNVSAVAQAAATASLDDREHVDGVVKRIVAGREQLTAGLAALGVPFTPSLGNFVTIELGTAAAPVVEAYRLRGVGVRPLAPYALTDQVRVSVGSESEVDRFLQVSQDVLADVPARVR